MQRIIFLVVLAVVSSSAMADWVEIYRDEKLVVYIDSETIRKNGSKVKLWQLVTYSEPQNNYSGKLIFYQSTKGQFELDCKAEQSRQIYFMLQSGGVGADNTAYAIESPQQWIPIIPDSTVQTTWKYACDKKYRAALMRKQSRQGLADEFDAIEVEKK